MSHWILGIDPGWSGGAALLRDDGTVVVVDSFTKKTEVDIAEAVSFMRQAGPQPPESGLRCYLEKVNAFPGQGVSSTFKFGMIYGFLRGLLLGRCRMVDVTPQKWQKALGCMSHGDKNVTKAKAQALFPGVKVTHGNADALLIAYYGYQQERGK